MYFVYVLKSKKNGKLYIGFTNDFKKRLKEHNDGESKSTKPFIPWKPAYLEIYSSQRDAKNREYQLKKHAKAWGQLKRRIYNSILES